MTMDTITAYTPDEAKQKAIDMGYNVVKVYRFSNLVKWNEFSTTQVKIRGMTRLAKLKMWNKVGTAIIIEKVKGIPNKSLRPYEYINHVRVGKCKSDRCVEIRKKSDDTVVATAPTKLKAMRLAKSIMKDFREDLYAKTIYISRDIDFELNYKGGDKSRLGEYLVFSVDKEDLRVYKIHHQTDKDLMKKRWY